MDTFDTQPKQSTSLGIPIAIIFGFGLVAAAIFFSGNNPLAAPQAATAPTVAPNEQVAAENGEIPPVSEADYIRGNPNATIVLVEYSDYDCPFCKQFHNTMNRIIDKYGANGDVAWVYRHFPLQQLHPNAPTIAVAAECVGELGGNNAFWIFSDQVFDQRGTNEPTNMARLSEFAETAGVDAAEYEACMTSGRHQEKVAQSVQEAFDAGARGTPHTFVLVGDQQGIINGAQPFENVDRIIGNLIGQIGGTAPETAE